MHHLTAHIDIIAQNNRFDIVKDYGCFAAVHPSPAGIVLVWVIPLITAFAALFLTGFALHRCLRIPKHDFTAHLEQRPNTMLLETASQFTRRAASSVTMLVISLISSIFSLFSTPKLIQWKSWKDAHATMGVAVVVKPGDVGSWRWRWWIVVAMSVGWVLLLVLIGEEGKDWWKGIREARFSMDGAREWLRGIRL